MSQLDYAIDQAVGFEGMLADMMFDDVESGIAEGEVLIGKVVSVGTALNQVKHPAAATDITDTKLIKGVAVHHHAMEQKYPTGSGNYSYLDKSAVNVGRKVRVWVKPLTLVNAKTADVHVYFSGAQPKGSFGGSVVAGETAIMPNAKWKTSTTSVGQLAILEVDL